MESTRNKLIDILAKNDNQFISGQMLSDRLNISRSAIWKHMKELEKDGYIIEARPKLGYRISGFPNKISENTLQWGLKTKWLGQTIIHKKSTTSTQHLAHQAALEGAKHGTVFIADEQTMGKGRMDRKWHSKMHKGIWLSMLLRPTIPPHLAPQLTLLTGTVLAEVLEKAGDVVPFIKWPNDIILDDKKTAGILTEMQAEHDRIQYVVIGIGINVNHEENDFHEEVKSKATSLKIASKHNWDLNQLIQDILLAFESAYERFIENDFSTIRTKWIAYGYKMNQYVDIKAGNRNWEAKLIGIDSNGALLIENKDGTSEKLYSAEINWFKECK
ncbi:biotin--[acetyl-CoA-carboxylase] ligase [Virgibacillus sp. MG-45]|uniref:biotin--[acetyl-CoA-carboxylase] ligase n=1 Tax=Virgibacillus sp. MG-45 TaxID=3102791 RepID=UPI002EDB0436